MSYVLNSYLLTYLLPCEFGANPFSSSQDISRTSKKVTAPKQNL